MAGLIQRGRKGTWHMRMRVPVRYADVEHRTEITRSLKTDSKAVARAKLASVEAQEIALLDAKLACRRHSTLGDTSDREAYYRAFAVSSLEFGFKYKTTAELAQAENVGELIERMLFLEKKTPDATDTPLIDAIAGGMDTPSVRLSQLPELIKTIREHDWRHKNSDQIHTAMLPLNRAAERFIEALGSDRDVASLTEDDAEKYFESLEAIRKSGKMKVDTVNREVSAIAGMLRDFRKHYKQKPKAIFYGMRAADKREKKIRPLEIPVEWLETVILAPGAMSGLREDFQDVFIINAETGTRQSEVYNTPPSRFYLDHEYPHILIQDEDGSDLELTDGVVRREIKNMASMRTVPLVGVAYAAARRLIERGTYTSQKWRSYSGTMNKGFRARGLFPPDPPYGRRYYINGTRYAFETRMKNVGLHSDDRGEMMGHSVKSERNRELYGDEMPLWKRFEIAELISFKPPHAAE